MSGDPILASLARLEAGQAEMGAGVVKLDTSVAKLQTSVAKLEAGQTSLRVDFLAELGSTRGAIMERIDRLQNRFDEMLVDANAGFNNMARVEDRGISTQKELRAMVEQYNYLYRRMQGMDARLRSLEDKQP
jgi:prefoldin subunit 5